MQILIGYFPNSNYKILLITYLLISIPFHFYIFFPFFYKYFVAYTINLIFLLSNDVLHYSYKNNRKDTQHLVH